MLLSIVIVSYNVSHFLQQTLQSVQRAIQGLDAEVWVVDNASADDSVAMVQQHFPWVRLVANTENVGFSRANNQAIRQAAGQYILLLNPDIVLAEDVLHQCLAFAQNTPDAGGIGVRMLDGQGIFLPESKRGLPTPWVSFCKILGLGRVVPSSPLLNRYYMGWLFETGTHEVEVLSGAFMLMPKAVLDQVGLLDETFFMYGEDVDLSYRITLGGYKNYYLGHTPILHYKGESTKKGSLKYVKVFYQAMSIFAQKHFAQGAFWSRMLNMGIQLAIVLRASISVLHRLWLRFRYPLLDAALIWLGMYFLKEYWQANHKKVPGNYPPDFMHITVPLYISAWLSGVGLSGGYLPKPNATSIVRGLLVGMVVISAVTNFFDDWRFSKALILLGTAWAMAALLAWRLIIHYRTQGNLSLAQNRQKRVLVVGQAEEAARVVQLLDKAHVQVTLLGHLTTEPSTNSIAISPNTIPCLGSSQDLVTISAALGADEIIFCDKNLSHSQILGMMQWPYLGQKPAFRIVPEGTEYVIGSSDKNTKGDFYSPDATPPYLTAENRQRRRSMDLGLALGSLLLFPILLFMPAGMQYLGWAMKVLSGSATWVAPDTEKTSGLPPALVNPGQLTSPDTVIAQRVNELYCTEYSVWLDLKYWWAGLWKKA